MCVRFEDFKPFSGDGLPFFESEAGLGHREPLNRYRAPVFESCISDIHGATPARSGQLPRHPLRVRVALADFQKNMLPGAGGRKAELLLHHEVFRLGAEDAASHRSSIRSGRIKHRPAEPLPAPRDPRHDPETPTAQSSSP